MQAAGTVTEYFLGDALGSVRQLTNASSAVTYARAYDPYGVVTQTGGSSHSAYAFTGASSGDSTQLLYLRARQYAPGMGRFLTQDMWMGTHTRPLSFNRWMYVEGNPVNLVDPSGLIPTDTEIWEGRHVYSCSCGWIDLDHADPDKSKAYFELINARPHKPQNVKARDDVLLVTLHVYPGPFTLSNNAVIKTGLNDNDKKEVALGMFMAQEENYENLQGFFGHPSSYSEEDLVSDLIGFHMWVQGMTVSAREDPNSWYWLSRTCGFPLDREQAKKWSLAVYYSYPEFEEVHQWASPRLVCTEDTQYYCGIRRSFPQIFQTISPQKPSIDSNWWWYRGVYIDGPFLATDIKDVYFLQDIREQR